MSGIKCTKGDPLMAQKDNQHVVPRSDGWAVRGEGNSRDTRRFGTQKDAIRAARRIARNRGSELLIHGRDGRIRDRRSYGSDPHAPSG